MGKKTEKPKEQCGKNTWDTIWVVGERNSKKEWRGMSKVLSQQFFCCAEDAFKARDSLLKEIRGSFGVFEIPIEYVGELQSPHEEGKIVREVIRRQTNSPADRKRGKK